MKFTPHPPQYVKLTHHPPQCVVYTQPSTVCVVHTPPSTVCVVYTSHWEKSLCATGRQMGGCGLNGSWNSLAPQCLWGSMISLLTCLPISCLTCYPGVVQYCCHWAIFLFLSTHIVSFILFPPPTPPFWFVCFYCPNIYAPALFCVCWARVLVFMRQQEWYALKFVLKCDFS